MATMVYLAGPLQLPKGWKLFKDIPCGSHFEDNHGRRFIKMVNKTACGIPQTFERLVANPETNYYSNAGPFNAVDYDGFVGKCPDWVPFRVIRKRK